MGIRSWLTGQDLKEKRSVPEYRSGLADPSFDVYNALTTGPTASGQRVTVETSLGLSPVWSAVSIIAEQVGQLPLKLYRSLDDTRIEAREHRAWRMLHDKPNDLTPADRFWSSVTGQLLLWGNAYIEKGRNFNGQVEQLWLLDPSRMTVEWDPERKSKRFIYDLPEDPARRKRVYEQDDLLHIFGLSLDGIMGESVIARCRNSLGTAMARDEYEGGFYNRGATLSGVVEHPGKLGQDGAVNLKSSFSTIYGGSGQAHQVGVLEEGATFRTMTSPMADLEFVSSQQLSRTDIAVMFKLPPNYLGGSTGDSLTYATVEANQVAFATHAIAPWTNVIAKAISNDTSICPQSVHHAEFVIEAMLRSDSPARARFYTAMHAMGAMTTNEIRARENLPALTDAELEELKPEPPKPPTPTVNVNGNGGPPANVAPLRRPTNARTP